jgi:hypothetical protein
MKISSLARMICSGLGSTADAYYMIFLSAINAKSSTWVSYKDNPELLKFLLEDGFVLETVEEQEVKVTWR